MAACAPFRPAADEARRLRSGVSLSRSGAIKSRAPPLPSPPHLFPRRPITRWSSPNLANLKAAAPCVPLSAHSTHSTHGQFFLSPRSPPVLLSIPARALPPQSPPTLRHLAQLPRYPNSPHTPCTRSPRPPRAARRSSAEGRPRPLPSAASAPLCAPSSSAPAPIACPPRAPPVARKLCASSSPSPPASRSASPSSLRLRPATWPRRRRPPPRPLLSLRRTAARASAR